MVTSALALVLTSAVLLASWNLLAKRVRGVFGVAWGYAMVGSVVLAPVGLFAWLRMEGSVSLVGMGFLLVSALLHVGYFTTLQRAYGWGDLSLVYPLARGTGPALAVLGAVVLLGERPGPWGWLGAGLVAVAAFGLASCGAAVGSRRAVLFGLGTGAFIGAYTLWDAVAVTRVGVPVAVFAWLSEVVRAVLLAPMAWRRRAEVARVWRESRGALVGWGC